MVREIDKDRYRKALANILFYCSLAISVEATIKIKRTDLAHMAMQFEPLVSLAAM